MKEAILDFNKQFGFEPQVVNEEKLKPAKRFVVLGMGGSHLAADIIKNIAPGLPLRVHKDYGLPETFAEDMAETLFIASSYSGNTEEVMSGAQEALDKKYALACVAVGGELLDFAKKHSLPYIEIPDTHIQPRLALGFSAIALAQLIGDKKLLKDLKSLEKKINPAEFQSQGKTIAESIKNFVPVIYTSANNRSIAYNWKIKFNETGKIPAFYNVFPELNHNEMTGFDVIPSTKELSQKLFFIFITDPADHPRIQKRMKICKDLYEKRGLKTIVITTTGSDRAEKIFNSLVLADWTAYYAAQGYGTEAEQVPMVEEFKKLVSQA